MPTQHHSVRRITEKIENGDAFEKKRCAGAGTAGIQESERRIPPAFLPFLSSCVLFS